MVSLLDRVVHTWHKDCLSWLLQDLQGFEFRGPGGELCPGVDDIEPSDSLVLLVPPLFSCHFDQLSGGAGREQAPTFVSLD